MGRTGSAVAAPGYERLEGEVPVLYPSRLAGRAREVHGYLEQGYVTLARILDVEPPELETILLADEDRGGAPRENEHPYPPGLPYFTRSVEPPALVLPEDLSPVFKPRTAVTLPLAVWHELAHAFLLQREVVRAPAWLQEFVPQAASAAIARRAGLPLDEHLALAERDLDFSVRLLRGAATSAEQMSFQNLLLSLGAAALEEFGDGFLKRLFHALRNEREVVERERAQELLADALGPGGREWLESRPEF